MKKTLTWLHLSDLHLCSAKFWEAHSAIEKLKLDLSKMKDSHQFKLDLLFFTGDLAYGQLSEKEGFSLKTQFEEVASLLDWICKLFDLLPERVFIVPGNHDINRNSIGEMQGYFLDAVDSMANHDDAVKKINNMLHEDNLDWKQFMRSLDDYKNFIRENYPDLLSRSDSRNLTYAINVDINGIKVGIAGLNSAWSCGTRKNAPTEKAKLWLGGKWQIKTLSSQLKGSDIQIALAHHPFSWLVPQENPAIDPLLEQEFKFFLHGHEHQNWIENKANAEFVRIGGGACHAEKPPETGYSFVRLDFTQKKGEIWLRKLDDIELGWIPRSIPGKTNDHGLYTFNLNWLEINSKTIFNFSGSFNEEEQAEIEITNQLISQ